MTALLFRGDPNETHFLETLFPQVETFMICGNSLRNSHRSYFPSNIVILLYAKDVSLFSLSMYNNA